jgi:hypothetical protein
MNRRFLLLTLVIILVTAAAVPAFGAGTETVSPTFDGKASTRALAKARLALLTARSAQGLARNAFNNSKTAKEESANAKTEAAATKATLESLKVKSAVAAGEAKTESQSFVSLPGGPSVTVTVPSSGLIEVWGQATMSEPGAVSLFEDGQQMAGQAKNCGPEEIGGVLFAGFSLVPGPITAATPASTGFCSTEGAPGSVLFQTTPGSHTYELRYSVGCGCAPEVTFSNRLLRVAPRL